MTTNTSLITLDTVSDVVSEIESAFNDIPFENSDFQTERFVLASQITPERAYRALGLRMMSKIQALREAKYNRAKEDIDLEELTDKVNNTTLSIYDRRRAELDIQQKMESRGYSNKLINDAIHELNLLYSYFVKMPRYTREDFEKGERNHFEKRLNRQVKGIQGAAESLVNMNHDFDQMTISITKALSDDSDK